MKRIKKVFLKNGSLNKDLEDAIKLSTEAYLENKENVLRENLTMEEAVSKNRVISKIQLSIGSLVGAIIILEARINELKQMEKEL